MDRTSILEVMAVFLVALIAAAAPVLAALLILME